MTRFEIQDVRLKRSVMIFIFISCFLTPSFAQVFAQTQSQPTDYKLLAPLPLDGINSAESKTTTAEAYIAGMFKLLIALSAIFAVVMIIVGGVEYMSTDAFTGKSSAKERIQNAIWGLLLVIGAWLILFTINPNLVRFNFEFPSQEIPTTPTGGGGGVTQGPSYNNPWPSDLNTRNSLINDPNTNINVGKRNCVFVGETNCTSLHGMSSAVINGIQTLAQNCNGCIVTITGGTEYWLHGNRTTEIEDAGTQHVPGGSVIDLSAGTDVTSYIKTHGTRTTAAGCATGEKYVLNGATYVLESNPAHWHVCF